MLIMAGIAGATPTQPPSTPTAASSQVAPKATDQACRSQDPRDIVVCAQRGQPYRLDPDVMDANRQVETNNRSATSAIPPAQASCSASPMHCPMGLESLDVANVAIVAATIAVKAAKGEDWKSAFKPGGPDEYQLYQQAKRRREAKAMDRLAADARSKARAAERAKAPAESGRQE